VGGAPVWRAEPSAVRLVASIALERHRAANWLVGVHPRFSRVVAPT
jgi:hypothetical protein